MEIKVLSDKRENLLLQRNIVAIACVVSMLTNILLGISLLTREKQTFIVPAHINKEIMLSNKRLSVSYLEEMTVFYLELLLGLTESNIEHNSNLVLRHIHPSFYNHLRDFFDAEKKRYKEFRLSTHFKLSELKIDDTNLVAEARGVLISYFGNSGKSEDAVAYRIKYDYSGGILTIKDFSIIKDKKEESVKE